jgi:transketolase
MKKTFDTYLHHVMRQNDKIAALFADSDFEKREELERDFPDRTFNFGMAECNMVSAAAGLANEGLIPIVYTVGSFLVYRAYESIRNDVCIQNLNVKFAAIAAGLKVNNFGPTHHTTEDIAALRVMPNLTLVSPASPKEVLPVMDKSIEYAGPVYIRLGKAFETEIYETDPVFEIGKSVRIQEGNDLTIIATGAIISNAIEAAKRLNEIGVSSEIINMSTIKPIDAEAIIQSALKTGKVITLEEHQINGGLGGAVSEILCAADIAGNLAVRRMGLKDTFCTEYGWHRDLLEAYGLTPEDIFECGRYLCR